MAGGCNTITGTQYNDTLDLSATELVNIANIDGDSETMSSLAVQATTSSSVEQVRCTGRWAWRRHLPYQRTDAPTTASRRCGYDVIQGGDGDDVIRVNYFSGTSTVEKIDGGLGNNVIAGTHTTTPSTCLLRAGQHRQHRRGVGNDVITGSAATILSSRTVRMCWPVAQAMTLSRSTEPIRPTTVSRRCRLRPIQGGDGDDVIRVNYFSGTSTVEKIDGGLATTSSPVLNTTTPSTCPEPSWSTSPASTADSPMMSSRSTGNDLLLVERQRYSEQFIRE